MLQITVWLPGLSDWDETAYVHMPHGCNPRLSQVVVMRCEYWAASTEALQQSCDFLAWGFGDAQPTCLIVKFLAATIGHRYLLSWLQGLKEFQPPERNHSAAALLAVLSWNFQKLLVFAVSFARSRILLRHRNSTLALKNEGQIICVTMPDLFVRGWYTNL